MAFMFFPTRSSRGLAKNLSMFIRSDSRQESCGDPRPRPGMRLILISGMTTLSKSEFESVARLPQVADGPVFAEPWQAQAFAMAVKLSELGYFTWKEWAAALAEELRAAANRGAPDDGSNYYHHWLTALERLVATKGLVTSEALATRKEAWAEAYRDR